MSKRKSSPLLKPIYMHVCNYQTMKNVLKSLREIHKDCSHKLLFALKISSNFQLVLLIHDLCYDFQFMVLLKFSVG